MRNIGRRSEWCRRGRSGNGCKGKGETYVKDKLMKVRERNAVSKVRGERCEVKMSIKARGRVG